MQTHLTPFTVPPLSTQRRLPSLVNASDIGNSPSDDTGSPIRLMLVGALGSIEKRETVLEPACRLCQRVCQAQKLFVRLH